jgi:hydroxypyruvate isomerase
MDRREALGLIGATTLGSRAMAWAGPDRTRTTLGRPRARAGRLKQSACRWAYKSLSLADLCRAGAAMGLAGIDLLGPEDWEPVRAFGLVCSMGYPTARGDFIATGFNDRANHAMLLRELEQAIPLAKRHAVPNVIAMFGNRRGKSDSDGIAACVAGLNAIKALADEQGVTICLELLNSKVDHQDYQGDRTAFGVAVVTAVGSPRVKLLYDIYHMQIMEGDIIRTIRDNRDHIAHFHTGGVPGRHELDGTQELNWHAVATAIADTGFPGYVAHEFVPTRDALHSLREAVETCTV